MTLYVTRLILLPIAMTFYGSQAGSSPLAMAGNFNPCRTDNPRVQVRRWTDRPPEPGRLELSGTCHRDVGIDAIALSISKKNKKGLIVIG